MSSRKCHIYCSVYGCLRNDLENPELSFFKIPTELERRIQWLQLISREDLIHKRTINRVCEIHFNTQDIRKTIRKTLKNNALPCLNLPEKQKEDKQTQTNVETAGNSSQTSKTAVCNTSSQTNPAVNTSSQTIQTAVNTSKCSSQIKPKESCASKNENQSAASLSADTPPKRKLISDLRGSRERVKALKQDPTGTESQISMFHKLCDRFLSGNLAELVKAQANLKPS